MAATTPPARGNATYWVRRSYLHSARDMGLGGDVDQTDGGRRARGERECDIATVVDGEPVELRVHGVRNHVVGDRASDGRHWRQEPRPELGRGVHHAAR